MVDERGRAPVPDPAMSRRCDPHSPAPGAGQDLDGAEGLIQLSRVVQVLHGRVADVHGLTQVQARMICILASGPRGMAELAQCLGVEKATLTGVADRAERRGLVIRSPVPGDRRALDVSLTATGRRTAAKFHADAVKRLDHLLSPLTWTELDQFRRAMAKIVAEHQQDTHADAPGERSPGLAWKGDSP